MASKITDAIFDLFDGGDDDKKPKKKEAPGISDAEAQELAKQRFFRSGTILTNALGEPISSEQTEGTRLV